MSNKVRQIMTPKDIYERELYRTIRQFKRLLDTQSLNVGDVIGTDGTQLVWTSGGGGGGGNGLYGGSGVIADGTVATLDAVNAAFSFNYDDDVPAIGIGKFTYSGVQILSPNQVKSIQVSNNDVALAASSGGGAANFTISDAVSFLQLAGDATFVITDSTGDAFGLQYAADYSATISLNNRSIPDVGTVNGLISTALATIPISTLDAATGTNAINNAGFAQEWQWNSLAGATALKLSSTSTAAASSAQKLLDITLSGANANSGQITYGATISNSHTGAGAINYGLYSSISNGGATGTALIGAASGAQRGVAGTSASGYGVYANSASGTAAYLIGGSGYGAEIRNSSGSTPAGLVSREFDQNDNVGEVLRVELTALAGGADQDFGPMMTFYGNNDAGTSKVMARLRTVWTDATNGDELANLRLELTSGSTPTTMLFIAGTGQLALSQYGAGAFTGTATKLLSVTNVGNVIETDIPTGGIGNVHNGGDSFGGAMTLGTNDSNTLTLETNNTARAVFDTSGHLQINGQYNSLSFALTDGNPIALDWNNSNVQYVTIGANRTFTFANPKEGGRYVIAVTQGGAGSFTVTWPTIKWTGGAAPTLTTTAGKTDVISLMYINGSYHGSASLNH